METYDTQYGFKFGPMEITRVCSDDKQGWAVLNIETKKGSLEICVTKAGNITLTPKGARISVSASKR